MKQKTTLGFVAGMCIGFLPVAAGVALLPALPAVAQAQTKQTAPFAAVSAAWAKIEASAADLDKTVKAGKLGDVHEVAFAIRDDVVTLPAKSAALSADKKKKLAGYAKTVSEIAGLLDKYGDAGDAKGVKAQHERMKTTLKSIKALYPAGTFKTMSGTKMSPMSGKKMGDMKGMKM